MKQVKDIMTSHVETIRPDTPVSDIAKKMKRLNVGILPVMEDGKILGIVTDRDMVIRALAENWDVEDTKASDVMSRDLIYCYEDDSAEDAARLMQKNQVRRLVILDRDREIVGIVSLGDIATELKKRKVTAKTLQRISEPAGIGRVFGHISEGVRPFFFGTIGLTALGAGIYWLANKMSSEGFESSDQKVA